MDGKEIHVPGLELLHSATLFHHAWLELELESLPNRDSLQYENIYGIQGAETVYRGMLCYQGFSSPMHVFMKMGLFEMARPKRHWCGFLRSSLDPDRQGVDDTTKLIFIQIFTRRVREGHCGRGHQVQASSIETAIRAVGKTIELAGFRNPLHQEGTTNYHAALKLQIESYQRGDPTTKKQRAVPVAVPNCIFRATRNAADRRTKAVGELALMVFYFLFGCRM